MAAGLQVPPVVSCGCELPVSKVSVELSIGKVGNIKLKTKKSLEAPAAHGGSAVFFPVLETLGSSQELGKAEFDHICW